MAHQNSQFAVRAPVAARSRLGAARRYRLRSPLGVARLIPENSDSAPGCHVSLMRMHQRRCWECCPRTRSLQHRRKRRRRGACARRREARPRRAFALVNYNDGGVDHLERERRGSQRIGRLSERVCRLGWVTTARAKLVIPDLHEDLQKESPWHFHQWKPSGWSELRSRARSENPQVAIDLLWRAAGEDNIRATALECKNAKAFDGNLIEIPAHYWAHLKPDNDRGSGKAILSGPDGRVYREVKFLRLDGKKLWPKSPPLSGEPLEHVKKPEQTRPAERELLGPKARRPAPPTTTQRVHLQSERAERHIARLYPDGTNEISSEVIRKKLEKDPVLLAELAERGGKPPSRASIDRARGLRR